MVGHNLHPFKAELGLPECLLPLRYGRPQTGSPFQPDRLRNLLGKIDSSRTRPPRIGKHMGITQGQAMDKPQQDFHILLPLAGEACQDVRTKAEYGPVTGKGTDGILQHGRAVMAAPHAPQHRRGGMLERNVQMGAKQDAARQRIKAAGIQLRWLQRTDAQTRPARKLRSQPGVQKGQQIPEITVGRLVPTILAQIDAREHQFGMAGPQQAAGFFQYGLRGAAARFATGERHNAVGAAVGAAILHLEHGPGPPEMADLKGRPRGITANGPAFRPRAAQEQAFVLLRHKQIRLGKGRAGPWSKGRKESGGAAGQDDSGPRGCAAQPENRIAGIALAPGGNGATIDANDIGVSGRAAFLAAQGLPRLAQSLTLVLVDLATKGEDMKRPCGHPAGVRKSHALDKRLSWGQFSLMRQIFLLCCLLALYWPVSAVGQDSSAPAESTGEAASAVAAVPAPVPSATMPAPPTIGETAMEELDLYCLRLAYPAIVGMEDLPDGSRQLVFSSGARVPYRHAAVTADTPQDADVRASMAEIYPLEPARPAEGCTAGQVRSQTLLEALYGKSSADVAKQVQTAFVQGMPVRLSRPAALAVQKADAYLVLAVRKTPQLYFLLRPEHSLERRMRPNEPADPHCYGIALDCASDMAPYREEGQPAAHPLRQEYPSTIVAVMEQQGFVWGGKWTDYTFAHFEYRPELLCKAAILRAVAQLAAQRY